MTDEKPQRISIGFISGQSVGARVNADELARLRGALEGGGWYELRAEDGTVVVDLGKVVYVRLDDEDHRVGFGS